MKRLIILSLVLILGHIVNAQKVEKENLIIAYYNLDNMFDFEDNDGRYDDEYTSGGTMFWGEQRYNSKLDKIAGMIGSISGKDLPGIIVISEIESKKVVSDLLNRKELRREKYSTDFHKHPEGKSIAILSSEGIIMDIKTSELKIDMQNQDQTGSIFYSELTLADGNKYYLFINNWTERSEGSEPSRMNCAVTVRKEIDKILNFERDARIIVMGTFFDEPTNKSILAMLNATNKRKNINYRDLFNPFYDAHNHNNEGTVVVNSSLQMYDFIIVSPSLLRENEGFSCGFTSGKVFTGGRDEPLPTFKGGEYLNGASKHFPVYIGFSRLIER